MVVYQVCENMQQSELGTIIASRKYHAVGGKAPGLVVEVQIGKPTKAPRAEGDFLCRFRLRSSGQDCIETVYGVDELQALQLALGYLEAKLKMLVKSSGAQLRWEGGEAGDLGIIIPNFYD